ncbi:MAG: hypothetical protein IPL09_09335 [Bacteroidetes bacterium]|nr:hypothetical protein [Bacteroidota bacterium]
MNLVVKYPFWSPKQRSVVGALNFSGTEHDNKTLTTAIDQYERLTNRKAKSVLPDRVTEEPVKSTNKI